MATISCLFIKFSKTISEKYPPNAAGGMPKTDTYIDVGCGGHEAVDLCKRRGEEGGAFQRREDP